MGDKEREGVMAHITFYNKTVKIAFGETAPAAIRSDGLAEAGYENLPCEK